MVWTLRWTAALVRLTVILSIAACARAPYGVARGTNVVAGALEHVSLAWIEGWACNPLDTAQNLTVDIYASAVERTGSSHCVQRAGATLCHCGTAVARHLREQGVATQCAGTAWKGFHLETPPALLDGVQHNVFAFTGADSASPLGAPFSFTSDTLYQQEFFGNGSVDFHLLVNQRHGMGELPAAEVDMYGSDHTLFVFWPPQSRTTAVVPTSIDFSASTGVQAALPRRLSQRQVGDAGCYEHDGTTRCNSVSVAGSSVGFVVDTRALGYYSGFVGMQIGWSKPPRPWVSGSKLRVSATVTQPLAFKDDVTTSPDNIAYWYFVLFLNDRSQLTGHKRGVWLTQQAWQSRSEGLEMEYCTHCDPAHDTKCPIAGGRCNNDSKQCEYPCVNLSSRWCPAKPDQTCFQYRLNNPRSPAAWISGDTSYVQLPLLQSASQYLSLCGNGSYADSGSHGKLAANWTGPGTHIYCFEISRTQLISSLVMLNMAALRQDRGAPCSSSNSSTTCSAGRACVHGECRVFGQLSTDPSDFELQFMLINAEAVGPGHHIDGTPDIARIGLSVQDYTAKIVR
eukprot:SAG31_NODE_1996_length_6700_cov_4.398424_2_plen_568_part_00